ncbi:hypothetical protein JOC85_000930 [Bacillus mesophilus]|uniref:Sulfite exporter TauE/SafE family protein n=1 Tax=Bacillus mesophilus TaxID=1808955 RepID=A0A6M0QBW0_9BACI|nr:sulfite exporter TauE/SafE family protein [Bacillus mesophilus]MBM7660163.1 hypothetical protein [Bacillus mesophilus]NEY73815.1 sulfite exporter TauE/SafE family protein [Bacillus mesophilus]
MGNILLFSLIVGLATAIIVTPYMNNNKEKKSSIQIGFVVTFILSFPIAFVFYYLSNLDQNFSSLWMYLIFVTGVGALIATGKERMVKAGLFAVTLFLAIYMLSAPVWNANEKYELSEMDQKTEIEAFDETKTPASVPPQFARNKMRKAFGQVPDTSYYELGNLQIQKVNGEFVYIAPVEFSGFFKWLNGDSIPGYFTLSATDSSANPVFVKAEMNYAPSAYFQKNIERKIRMQFPTHIFYGDPQLEVDDEGTPYYIRTFGEFVSARNGFVAKGVVAVNPVSGAMNIYPLSDVPAFIDGAVSPESVSLQNSYFGNYVHGFWNSIFGKSDVKLPSDEGTEANVSPIFDKDGEMYYFTDFTSPKEGVDSMLGYSLTHARSGEATFYSGNLEKSYMDSEGALQIIEKKFVEKKWNGAMPILYNFYGEASWLAPVLDANGFLQNYFIVSAANPEISVFANTPNEALKKYKTALQRGGSTVDGTSDAEEKRVTGSIQRVYKEKVGDYTVVSFLLNTRQNFIVSSEQSPLVIYLQEGDQVNLSYLDTGEDFLPVKELTIEGLE